VGGTSLALMDAGVPLKRPVAGIAMGLIKEGNDFAVLSDILGDEDHLGDMDFKVAGTEVGVTSLQMDIKITGITEEIMRIALEQAHAGRIHILGEMSKALTGAREELGEHAGALPGLPVNDTLKREEKRRVTGTVSRDGLWRAQTPQGFKFDAILAAHRAAAQDPTLDFTDDAAVAEWFGLDVALVEGSEHNRKLTTAEDLRIADEMMRRESGASGTVRVGSGYDVHALGPGDAVILCGVRIPHEKRLVGHSDADVGLHALTDALLGTIADGDIGTHFPPSDDRWKGAGSEIFLKAAADKIEAQGGTIVHVDVTLLCEAPRIGPYREAMRGAIADILGIDKAQVSVKATTNEGLGFVGRGEGIAAMATATVRIA